ncbi:MAG: hypothetical protein ABW170_23160 [Candidatus Thiodiazotropha sp. L084R]
MRFPHLKIGQGFIYQGKRYSKTGPMTASEEESGESCMIRRSAEVMTLENSEEVKPTLPNSFSQDQVVELLEAYKDELKASLQATMKEQVKVSPSDLLACVDRVPVNEFLTRLK